MGGSGFIRRTSSRVVKFWVLDCWEIKAVEHRILLQVRTEYIAKFLVPQSSLCVGWSTWRPIRVELYVCLSGF